MNKSLAKCIKNKNLLASIQLSRITNAYESGLTEKCYNDCKGRFSLIHATNRIMYSILLDCVDEIEEMGLLKFDVKKAWNDTQRAFSKYDNVMRIRMSQEAWYLLQDYVVAAERGLGDELKALQSSMDDYMQSLGCENTELLSRLALSIRLAEISSIWFDNFFESYKELCGVDFSHEFKYAKMDVVLFNLMKLFDRLSKKNGIVDFGKSSECRNAANALQEKLASQEFLDKVAEVALSFSTSCKEEYEIIKKQNDKKYGGNN